MAALVPTTPVSQKMGKKKKKGDKLFSLKDSPQKFHK